MANETGTGELVRSLDWKGAFWVAAGVPPLVLFSIGGIAGTTGKLAGGLFVYAMSILDAYRHARVRFEIWHHSASAQSKG